MNLIELVKTYEREISDDSILVEYALYFKEVAVNRCKFVIDVHEELQILKDVFLKLMAKDKNAEIYVNTYSMDFTEENTYIYADSLWIDTILDVEEIYNLFSDSRKVEPTDIILLEDDETVDGTISLVMMADGKVRDYKTFIKRKQLCKIKSLYWD